jgi:hypothetical protein
MEKSSKSVKKQTRKVTKKKIFWNADKIVSLSAISISLFTLIILIYQARLLNRQFEVQRQQQYASVLPYLEIGPSFGNDYFQINIGNTGIGPAFIKDVYVMNSKERFSLDFYDYYTKYASQELQQSVGAVSYSRLYQGKVLQAGQIVKMISKTGDYDEVKNFSNFFIKQDSFKLVVEYASVYDERWIIDSDFPPNPMPKKEYILANEK